MNRVLGVFGVFIFSTATTWARSMPTMRTLPSAHPTFTYDMSGSSGTQNGVSYSEIKLGLNWYVTDWLNWRNALFTRFGSNIKSVNGLDSSLLATYDLRNDSDTLGVQAFVGPGVRIASEDNNAATATAGVIFTLGGIRLGGGAQYLSYFKTRKDAEGLDLPKSDTQYFIVIAGGGSF